MRADAIVVDERRLTKRISPSTVQKTYDDFQKRVDTIDDTDVELIISTAETTEERASQLLELGAALLDRLFGSNARTDVSVITQQQKGGARLRVSKQASRRVASALGVGIIGDTELENFITQRVSTEYQLMLLKFNNTDIFTIDTISVQFMGTGRRIEVLSRARRFR